MTTLALILLGLAALPLLLLVTNLWFYRRPADQQTPGLRVSVLIPARNEGANIFHAVSAALASEGVEVEVLVLDDGSTDNTAEIVADIASRDSRVRLLRGKKLPAGWLGKNHACAQLAAAARNDWLLFQDADVRLGRGAAARTAGHAARAHIDLLSGVPQQSTLTTGERLIIPLINLVLLGYLPMAGVRWSRHPMFAAGVGQFVLARRDSYQQSGGHGAIADRIQDGVELPRLFRARRLKTDLIDLTDLVFCRMYRDFSSVWQGFAKNAHEGMGSPAAIGIWTTLLLGGHVLPWLGVLACYMLGLPSLEIFLAAGITSLVTRLLVALRFAQDLSLLLLHPVGVLLIVAIQWYGLTRHLLRRPIAWKGRVPT